MTNQGLELLEEYDAPDMDKGDGSTVSIEKYGLQDDCLQVWLYTVNGGGHDWPGAFGNMDIDSSREIWNFFDSSCVDEVAVTEIITSSNTRKLVKTTDVLGREIEADYRGIIMEIYDDGSSKKKMVTE